MNQSIMLPAETYNKNIDTFLNGTLENPEPCVGLFLNYIVTECEEGVIQMNCKPFESHFDVVINNVRG